MVDSQVALYYCSYLTMRIFSYSKLIANVLDELMLHAIQFPNVNAKIYRVASAVTVLYGT